MVHEILLSLMSSFEQKSHQQGQQKGLMNKVCERWAELDMLLPRVLMNKIQERKDYYERSLGIVNVQHDLDK